MANLDFFAAHDDLIQVLEFVFLQPDVRVFDMYSDYGEELTEFKSVDEIARHYPLGADTHGNGLSVTLQLWSSAVMTSPQIERLSLSAEHCGGHTFRYKINGWGPIQLYLGGVHQQAITKSHYGHNSQKRARAWDAEAGVDWDALAKLSNKIQYHIRRRLAVASVPGRPILPQAYRMTKEGWRLTEDANSPWYYDTTHL